MSSKLSHNSNDFNINNQDDSFSEDSSQLPTNSTSLHLINHNDMTSQPDYYEEIPNVPSISRKHHLETKNGIPYEIEGNDANFIAARCIDVDKKTWEKYKKASLGRKESSLYTAFLQQVPSNLKRTNHNNDTRSKFKHRSIFGLPMMSPKSKFYLFWYILITILDITYTAFAVPIVVSFIWNMNEPMIKKIRYVDISVGIINFSYLF